MWGGGHLQSRARTHGAAVYLPGKLTKMLLTVLLWAMTVLSNIPLILVVMVTGTAAPWLPAKVGCLRQARSPWQHLWTAGHRNGPGRRLHVPAWALWRHARVCAQPETLRGGGGGAPVRPDAERGDALPSPWSCPERPEAPQVCLHRQIQVRLIPPVILNVTTSSYCRGW